MRRGDWNPAIGCRWIEPPGVAQEPVDNQDRFLRNWPFAAQHLPNESSVAIAELPPRSGFPSLSLDHSGQPLNSPRLN